MVRLVCEHRGVGIEALRRSRRDRGACRLFLTELRHDDRRRADEPGALVDVAARADCRVHFAPTLAHERPAEGLLVVGHACARPNDVACAQPAVGGGLDPIDALAGVALPLDCTRHEHRAETIKGLVAALAHKLVCALDADAKRCTELVRHGVGHVARGPRPAHVAANEIAPQ